MMQTGARQRLARLRGRLQRANAANPLPTSKEQILAARKLPVAELRQLASDQIGKAKEALEKASGLDTWNRYNPLTVIVNDRRWGPYARVIADAVEAFDRGELDTTEAAKTEHYLTAWTTARLAVHLIAKEARLGPTQFLSEVKGFVMDEAPGLVVDGAGAVKEGLDKGYARVEKTTLSMGFILVGGVVLYLLVSR